MILLKIPGYVLAILRAGIIALLMFLMLVYYLIASSIFFKHTPESAFKLRVFFIKLAIPILGIKVVEKLGEPIDETALYVSNHRSFSDPLVLCRYVNANVIAKAEVAGLPIIDKGARVTGVIYVKRDSVNSRKDTRKTMVHFLKQGLNIIVYPEGTTNDLKQVMEYRMGTFKEAAENNIPVVPVACEYKSELDLWKDRGLFEQLLRQFSKWRTYVKIHIGEGIKSNDPEYLRDTCVNWTNQRIEKMHNEWGSHFVENQKA